MKAMLPHRSGLTPNNGSLLSEDGPWANDTMSSAYTNNMRIGLSLHQPGGSAWAQSYGYDAANRLQTLVSPAGTFTYVTSTAPSSYGHLPLASFRSEQITLPVGSIGFVYNYLIQISSTSLRNSAQTVLNAHNYN